MKVPTTDLDNPTNGAKVDEESLVEGTVLDVGATVGVHIHSRGGWNVREAHSSPPLNVCALIGEERDELSKGKND